MPGTPRQKQKTLFLLRILYERTDASHALTLQEIAEQLRRCGIKSERKSLYRDLEAIADAGFRIERVRTKDVRYYWADRPMSESDCLLITALLQTGRAVPRKRKPELIRKLLSLAPISARRELLAPEQIIPEARDTVTERVYSKVEFLCGAIRAGTRVHFSYHGGETPVAQTASPYRIAWQDGYYLVAADIRGELTFFRVDRIHDLQMTQLPVQDVREAGGDLDFDLNQYLYGTLFSAGESERVVFQVEKPFLPTAEKRLPPDAAVEEIDREHYRVTCDAVPEEWYGFLLCHPREMTLLRPAAAVQRLHALSAAAAHAYAAPNTAEYGINYEKSGKTVDKQAEMRYNKRTK